MRKPYGKRHEGRCLIACKTKDGDLVLDRNILYLLFGEPLFIKSAVLVRRQILETCQDAASLSIEGMLLIAYLVDDLSCNRREIDTGTGFKPCGDKDDGCGYGTFRNDLRIRILLKEMVNDSIAYLVAYLVRMSLRNRFGCEHKVLFHGFSPPFVLSFTKSGMRELPPMIMPSRRLTGVIPSIPRIPGINMDKI